MATFPVAESTFTMGTDSDRVIRLAEYTAPAWLIETVHLDATLDDTRTRVIATLHIKPNSQSAGGPLVLDGDDLVLESIALDGVVLPTSACTIDRRTLTLTHTPQRPFKLTIVTLLDPAANTQLMGLYRSSGNYCTQCEAEGFRRITFFLDRPDVMAVFTTRIVAKKDEAPVLLGNGNRVEAGDLPDGWHYAVWHDPHPKPAYLFALVGGRLGKVGGSFTTRSGRKVELGIYVESGKENRAGYALDALIRSMRWDEEAFGCEYDLDVFNIVAVSDFNMGAMENKGLNIFNDKYVLASPETATDADYANIEAIIAHEYFHNWTGNRITCRDWFQLCLKEGLTVFRDQEFSADQRSRSVKRIADVRTLRSQQFSEDAGPLAHPVRPYEYREINNFYTPTVYEKGAELIRMLKILLGADLFRQGMDLYLSRCDGTAATIEEFISCFADASGRDLGHFAQWYGQAGTPHVSITESFDPAGGHYRIRFTQATPATPGQPVKQAMVIPLALAFFDTEGRELSLSPSTGVIENGVFVLDGEKAELAFDQVPAKPILSALRGFSAPVVLDAETTDEERLVLLAHDTDPFNRWQAAQGYAMKLLKVGALAARNGQALHFDPRFAEGLALILQGDDHAFMAQILALPSENDVARELGTDVDPDAVHAARLGFRRAIGLQLGTQLEALCMALASRESFRPDAQSAGSRALRNGALDLLAMGMPTIGLGLAEQQYHSADNMTDRFAALSILAQHRGAAREAALDHFGQAFGQDPLVLDKWFSLQASIAEIETLDRIQRLMNHPGFSMKNPNRLRALIGTFAAGNPSQFNRADGAGYDLVSRIIIETDRSNPQVAARILGAFKSWRTLEMGRKMLAERALRNIADQVPLSLDVLDIVTRTLAQN